MQISETSKGDLAIFGEAVLWAFFPIVTILSYASFNPVTSLAWSTLFAALFFGLVVAVRGKAREILNPKIYRHIFIVAFLVGWLFYGFYFLGLKYTTAGNASIIALMELFFAYLFFNVWKKQKFSGAHTLGAVLMLIGALIILFPKQGLHFRSGDWLVLLASACAPVGNYYQQKIRKVVSSETILFLRSLLTFPFFFLLAYILKSQTGFSAVEKSLGFLFLNGFIVLGLSKIFWMEGIHRISVTRANALSSVAPLFTLVFAYFILRQAVTVWQLTALVPLGAGLFLLTNNKDLKLLD
jgi:drug/metabolite transporter (DMT)-like permease